MFSNSRRVLLIDKRVQGALTNRVIAYWLFYSFASFCILAGFPIAISLVSGNQVSISDILLETVAKFWPAFGASCFLVPLATRDVLRVSNRFSGPVYRLRRSLRALAQGEPSEPINLRPGDYWEELATEFNAVLQEVQQLRADNERLRAETVGVPVS